MLASARQMLEIARLGQHDVERGGERRLSGLYQAVTSGRSVTFTLQTLRGRIEGFDDWYDQEQLRLKADPVCVWFVDLRNKIEKRGDIGPASNSMYIHYLNTSDLTRNAPPGTESTFIGDHLGRNGWIVRLPDGRQETVYFTLPDHMAQAQWILDGAPGNADIKELLSHYLNVLEGVIERAAQRFSHD